MRLVAGMRVWVCINGDWMQATLSSFVNSPNGMPYWRVRLRLDDSMGAFWEHHIRTEEEHAQMTLAQ